MIWSLIVICLSGKAFGGREDIPVVEGHGRGVRLRVEQEVVLLTDESFDRLVLTRSLALVLFSAKWCHHCRQLEPEFATAAKTLAEEPVLMAKVDVGSEESLSRRLAVNSFPTLLCFQNGSRDEYDGARTATALVEWVRLRLDPKRPKAEPRLRTVTSQSLDAFVAKNTFCLIAFVTSSQPQCLRLAPELERAAQQLAEWGLSVGQCVEERALERRFAISSFPALFVFRFGKAFPYEGAREETAIVRFMRSPLMARPSLPVDSRRQLERALRDDWPTPAAMTSEKAFLALWDETAFRELKRDFRFVHVTDPTVWADLGESADSVVLFGAKWFSKTRHRMLFTNATTSQQISAFLTNHSRPLVAIRSPPTEWLFPAFPLVVVYYDVDMSAEHRPESERIRAQVVRVAERRPEVTFCVSRESDYWEEMTSLGLADSAEDINVGFFATKRLRFAFSNPFSETAFESFVNDVIARRAQPVLRSQRPPTPNTGHVTQVVGVEFDALVTRSSQPVLVAFVTDDVIDGHLEATARAVPGVRVARVDASENDFRDDLFPVSAFPTLYLWRQSRALLFASRDVSTDALVTWLRARDEL